VRQPQTSVVILGGGPGGYEAALVAAQLGPNPLAGLLTGTSAKVDQQLLGKGLPPGTLGGLDKLRLSG